MESDPIDFAGELAINVGFGAAEGYLGIFGGIGWNATVGAGSNVGSAYVNNWYYKNDTDHPVDANTLLTTATVGAVFGGGAKAMEVGKLKPVIDFITQKKIK